jgi:hypothetical protein
VSGEAFRRVAYQVGVDQVEMINPSFSTQPSLSSKPSDSDHSSLSDLPSLSSHPPIVLNSAITVGQTFGSEYIATAL